MIPAKYPFNNFIGGKIRHAPFHLLAALLVSLLAPCQGEAHSTGQPPEHHHGKLAQGEEGAAGIGVDEHLGAKIPLDATFLDETGKPVRLRELINGPTIILPVYFSCTNICNFLQSGLASVLPAVKRKPGEEYRVISISFDETETPELAARYKKTYLTSINGTFPENGWRFLTGDIKNIHRLTAAAGYRFKRQGRDFIHPVASFVTSGEGTIVRYLYGTTFLPKDLTLALLEAQEGKVGSTVRKVVGYCFTFDPTGKTYVFNLLRVSATVVILSIGAFLAFLLLTGRKSRKSVERP